MTLLPRRVLVLFAIAIAVGDGPEAGAQSTRVRSIQEAGRQWEGRGVDLDGEVLRLEDDNAFILLDAYNDGIKVVVRGGRPSKDEKVSLSGTIAFDRYDNPYIITERVNRADAPPPPETDVDRDGVADKSDRCPDSSPGARVDSNGCKAGISLRDLVIAALGLIALGLGLFLALRKPASAVPVLSPIPGAPPGGGANPTAGDIDEGKTIRIARPDSAQGTLQILPGRLEITGGGDQGRVSDIRFVRDPLAAGEPEMTFGRTGTLSPTHIILKSQTVSRLHAKMRFTGGKWSIQNFSDTNPLLLNGQPLRAEMPAATLTTGDTIEMGEVSFKFHER